MSLPHGRGKESFREFNRSLKDEVKDISDAIKDGEQYTQRDIVHHFNRLVNEYEQTLKDEGLDVETWLNRAIDKAYSTVETLTEKYQFPEESIEDDPPDNPEGENEEFDPDDNDVSDGTLFGHKLLTKKTKQSARALAKPRKRFFTSKDELAEYIQKVPYIMFIQIVKGSSGVIYRVWVEAAKDKKKRKNAS